HESAASLRRSFLFDEPAVGMGVVAKRRFIKPDKTSPANDLEPPRDFDRVAGVKGRCVQRVIAVGVRRRYARRKRSGILMDKSDGTEVSWSKRVGGDCIGAVGKDSGISQGDSGLLTELRSECD